MDALKARRLSPSRPKRILQKLARYFAELICTTLSAQLATLPLILSMFGAQSLLSLPVNLFAIPLAMLAYPVKSGVIGSDTVGQGVFYTLGALACLCLVALIAVACVMRAPSNVETAVTELPPKKASKRA